MKKYFGTDGIRGRVGIPPISADWVLKLGWAVGKVLALRSDTRPKVLIGKDTRVSGYLFESALEAGLSSAGADTWLIGPMPTPGVAYLTTAMRADIGIVISASHNPYYDNGIKFFSSNGMKISDEWETQIEDQLSESLVTVESRSLGKARRISDAQGRYIEFCKKSFPTHLTLRGLKCVVDCAHGATYRIAPEVLRELGAEVIEIGVQPDGFNINEGCGSTHPALLQSAVLKAKAHLGIAFDGDGDRLIMVDQNGSILDGDDILYILAQWYQKTNRLQGGVVGTVMTNYGLECALQNRQIPFKRASVGDRYVLSMLMSEGWNLGGETSGHILCLDRNTTGDGIIAALEVLAVLVATGKRLDELKQDLVRFPQVTLNVPINAMVRELNDEHTVAAVAAAQAILAGKGRVLLRPSGTEALIRVMVEGEDLALIESVAERLASHIRKLLPIAIKVNG